MNPFLSSIFKKYNKRVLFHLPNGETRTYGEIWNCAGIQAYTWKEQKFEKKPIMIQFFNSEKLLIESIAAWKIGSPLVLLGRHENIPQRKEEINPVCLRTERNYLKFVNASTSYEKNFLILYTSGSLGTGKQVKFTEKNILSNLEQMDKVVGEDMVCKDDVSFAALPWNHSYGFTCELLFLISRGASLYLPDPVLSYTSQMRKVKPTLLFTVPYFLEKVLRVPWWVKRTPFYSQFLGGKLKSVSVGGAFCPPEIIDEFESVFKVPVFQGYGMTEASPMIALSTTKDKKKGSVGKPLPDINIKFSEEGEILVSGPNIVASLPEERYQWINKKKYLKTGDIGSLDKDGFLFLGERLGDFIKLSNGLFINAPKIESLFAKEFKSKMIFENLVIIPHPFIPEKTLLVGFVDNLFLFQFDDKKRYLDIKKWVSFPDLKELGNKMGLLPHEIPVQMVYLRGDSFHKFCTPKLTIKRYQLQKYIQGILD